MPAKPLRLALGSLIIQKQYGYSDRELVEQLTENEFRKLLGEENGDHSLACNRRLLCRTFSQQHRNTREAITARPWVAHYPEAVRLWSSSRRIHAISFPGYQQEPPFVLSLLMEFCKRLIADILGGNNEMIIEYNHPDDHTPTGISGGSGEDSPARCRKRQQGYVNAGCHMCTTAHRVSAEYKPVE